MLVSISSICKQFLLLFDTSVQSVINCSGKTVQTFTFINPFFSFHICSNVVDFSSFSVFFLMLYDKYKLTKIKLPFTKYADHP